MTRLSFAEHLCKRNHDANTTEFPSNSTPSCSILCTDIITIGCMLPKKQTLLAVSYTDRTISFFDIEGRQQTPKSIRNKTSNTHMLKWRPLSNGKDNIMVIALALTSGIVSLWNYCYNDRASPAQWISNTNVHPSPSITALLWNDAGTHLVVGNDVGSCSLWKFDEEKFTLSIVAEYGSVEYHSITEVIFYSLPQDSAGRASQQFDDAFYLFFGTSSGMVVKADSQKNHSILASTASSVEKLLVYEEKQRLVILTKSFALIQAHFTNCLDNSCDVLAKLKLNVSSQNNMILKNAIWVGPGIIASAGGENLVRFWDINTHRNYMLPLNSASSNNAEDVDKNASNSVNIETIICLAFQSQTGFLSVATSTGAISLWKLRASGPSLDSINTVVNDSYNKEQTPWKPLFRHNTRCLGNGTSVAAQRLYCLPEGDSPLVLVVVTENSVCFAHQLELKIAFHPKAAAIQLTSSIIKVQHLNTKREACTPCFTLQVPASLTIKGLVVNEENLVFWGRKNIYVYGFRNEQWEHIADFVLSATSVALYRDCLYILLEDKILLTNKDGAQRLSLPLSVEKVGRPTSMSLMQNFLSIATEQGFLKVLDVSHKDPIPVGMPIRLSLVNQQSTLTQAVVSAAIKILSISCNATGNFVSLLVKENNYEKTPSYLYLVNVISGDQRFVEFSEGEVRRHFWDEFEPTLLCCEIETSEKEATVKVFFISSDLKTYSLDEFKIEKNRDVFFFGSLAPEIYYAEASGLQHDGYTINSVVLKDFRGHDLSDIKGTRLLLQFAFSLFVGGTDNVYQSVLQIEGELSIWEKMAHLSVKKRRQDIVDICLAKMGHATGIAAVSRAKKEPEKNAALAAAAIQLGLLSEAETLYKDCGRYDLLAELYVSQGFWEEAFGLSEEYDKINLKFLYHQHAKYCRAMGDIKGAISSFEKAGTHGVMVPRMLIERQLLNELRYYVKDKAENKMTGWWASYCESIGEHDEASRQFETSGDIASVVRLACNRGDWLAASDAVLNSGDAAAAYQLAFLYEREGKFHEAIQFYVKSGVLRPAIRLCKEHAEESHELMNLASKSDSVSFVLDCATFFLQNGYLNKAAELFHKGGQTAKALSLCLSAPFSSDKIRQIMFSATGELSQEDAEECSKLLIQGGMYSEAVEILFRSPFTFPSAIQVSLEHNILITEDMICKVMAHGVNPLFQESDDRNNNCNMAEIFVQLGKVCERQGQYVAGCKAYTKAGEHVKAMKCLLQSNDLQAIISYALASRIKENYILAANYLQSVQ